MENGEIRLLAFEESPFSNNFRREIRQWITGREPLADPSRYMPDLANLLSRTEVNLARTLLSRAKILPEQLSVAGTHGVTLRHHPSAHPVTFLSGHPESEGVSFQFSNPFLLAHDLGVPVVSQFRAGDLAAGGCGAPLTPILHRAIFSAPEDRIFLNIGGIANLTYLPGKGRSNQVLAFDTGPGNMLLDLTVQFFTQGEEYFDPKGARARTGKILRPLLNALLGDPYFTLHPPKSTGREEWGDQRLSAILEWCRSHGYSFGERWEDLLATFVELTAEGVRVGIGHLPSHPTRIIAGGGGCRNTFLIERIQALTDLPVDVSGDFGFPTQAIESTAFAYLALLTLSGRPGVLKTVTGAREETVLGQITPSPRGLSPKFLQDVLERSDIHLPFPDRPRTFW